MIVGWCAGMMAQLRAVSSIGSDDESGVCVFGKRIYRWARTAFISDQEVSVSCGLRGPLCYGIDGVPYLHIYLTGARNSGRAMGPMLG